MVNNFSYTEVLGVKIIVLPVNLLIQRIVDLVENNQRAMLVYVNAHTLNLAYEDDEFKRFLNDSAIVFCDGNGVQIGARILGRQIPFRYTPPDWLADLATVCLRKDLRMFFLGSEPGVADEAAAKVSNQVGGAVVAGTYHGYFNKSLRDPENKAVIKIINQSGAQILIVGFAQPMQEVWLNENWSMLNIQVAMTLGAGLDYLAGRVYRSPRWVTSSGYEWLVRLLVEPRRLWRRYILGNPLFIWRVIKEKFQ